MNQEIPVGPPSSDYLKSSSQIWFSYLSGHKSFNSGFFGINEASIAGVLHLRSTIIQPLIINGIKIKFFGEKTKGWAEPDTDDYEDKRNFEEICNVELDLWKNREFKKATNWDLPFSVPLPKNLPPSMSYGGGDKDNNKLFVRYRLIAIIGDITTEKIISVKANLTKYHLRPIMNPPLIINGDSSRCLEYEIRLNKTTYDHGETVKILMNLFLLNRKIKFKEIEICLKEYFIYGLSVKNKSRRLVTKIISEDEIQKSLDGAEWISDISLKLPCQNEEEPLLCDIDINGKKSMKILHKIKIKIKTNKGIFGTGGNVKLEKRINIKNFISKKTNSTMDISDKVVRYSNKPSATRSVSFNESIILDDSPPPSYNTSPLPLTSKNNNTPKVSKPPPPYNSNVETSRNRFRRNNNVVSPSSSSSSYLSKFETTLNKLLTFREMKTMNS